MQLAVDLSIDELGHLLMQMPHDEKLSHLAAVCVAFKLAVSHTRVRNTISN